MKNRILVFVVAFVATGLFNIQELSAQLSSSVSSRSWINVTSYYGVTNPNAYHLYIQNLERLGGGEIPSWRVKVKLDENYPIKKGNKTMGDFPPKFEIRFNGFVGGDASRIYTSSEYLTLSSTNWVSVIPESQLSLKESNSPGGNQFELTFDLRVLEGCHLADFPGNHTLGLQFKVEDQNGNKIDGARLVGAGITMGINIPYGQKCPFPDIPDPEEPVEPTFGFEVNANASLNFTKPEDYTKQVESTGTSWLKVISKHTPYIIRVKTNNADFVGDKGTVPVNVVSMKVEGPPSSSSGAAIPAISLSNSEQVVFRGKATAANEHILDVRYFITKSEAEKLATKTPGQYTTTLTYTLSPP